eukprot:TRINITY_DN13034_c0_g1_i1.p1 TRINITY_DN13034_c0_g1~~TRINITY_DN13034_c0_g1_i1.p1  ORF type:complete len:323 (+),score=66.91 TRINITY_DN13034_c0_g1_i1:38-970(+)
MVSRLSPYILAFAFALSIAAHAHAAPHPKAAKYGLNPGLGPVENLVQPHPSAENVWKYSGADLPSHFDARQAWPGCLPPVLNQGQCGSCWSFGASEQLSAHFCIATKGAVNVTLSPQNLLSCERLNLGCTLGSLPAWADNFLEKDGVVTLDCVPYTSGDGQDQPCQKKCTDPSVPFVKYYASNHTHVGSFFEPTKAENLLAIKEALTHGPLTATFNVYGDFMDYNQGDIYEHKTGGYEGMHTVMVVGYGNRNGTDYYIVQNSWGADWAGDGFFLIRAGIDTCSFERLMYQMNPGKHDSAPAPGMAIPVRK